jgi:predicted GNAT family N-acyltransferase
MTISFRLATEPQDIEAAFRIRYVVFVEEQGVPVDLEQDDRDDDADHVIAVKSDDSTAGFDAFGVSAAGEGVAVEGGSAIGAGRLVVEPAGYADLDPDLGPIGHLGRIAVVDEARGSGVGSELVRALETRASQRRLGTLYLASETPAVPFYERLGFAVYGDEFEDAGLPHRHMWRTPEE